MKHVQYLIILPLLIIIKATSVPATYYEKPMAHSAREQQHRQKHMDHVYRKRINRWTAYEDDFPVPVVHPERHYGTVTPLMSDPNPFDQWREDGNDRPPRHPGRSYDYGGPSGRGDRPKDYDGPQRGPRPGDRPKDYDGPKREPRPGDRPKDYYGEVQRPGVKFDDFGDPRPTQRKDDEGPPKSQGGKDSPKTTTQPSEPTTDKTDISKRPYNLTVDWVEEADEYGRAIDMDMFFDRTVILAFEGGGEPQIIVPGILIDSMHILTSYNPFRKMNIERGVAAILTGRKYNSTGRNYLKHLEYYAWTCAEQVPQISEESLTHEQWHGMDRRHSPVHDLMVIEIVFNLTLLDPAPWRYSFFWTSSWWWTKHGPMITEIAGRKDELGPEMKFASLAFRDLEHIARNNRLSSKTYTIDDSPLIDCEEWMPREWGHFICVRNTDSYHGVGSGALLIHNNKLYGIGSFVLRKTNHSILVFTDVRPYNKMIFSTCRTDGQILYESDEEGQNMKIERERKIAEEEKEKKIENEKKKEIEKEKDKGQDRNPMEKEGEENSDRKGTTEKEEADEYKKEQERVRLANKYRYDYEREAFPRPYLKI